MNDSPLKVPPGSRSPGLMKLRSTGGAEDARDAYFWSSRFIREIGRVLRPGGADVARRPAAGVVNDCWAIARNQDAATARRALAAAIVQDPRLLLHRPILGAVRRLFGPGKWTTEVGSTNLNRPTRLPLAPDVNQPTRLPLPPYEMRFMVSPITDESYYDNLTGDYIWGPLDIPPLAPFEAYRKVFDFGCGCGREARRLLLQKHPPEQYVGLDIHAGMINWCQQNLQSERFKFYHLDAWSAMYGVANTRQNRVQPINHLGSEFTIIEANSVFTHSLADQAEFYLDQMRSMLAPRGIIRGTWFFFNKKLFPMMGDRLNTLFVDEGDLTTAVYYDWEYFRTMIGRLGYRLVHIDWSKELGFHNMVYLSLSRDFADLSGLRPPSTSVIGY